MGWTDNKPLKNLHWARPLDGQRNDILEWMRAQEAAFDHSLAGSKIADAPGEQKIDRDWRA